MSVEPEQYESFIPVSIIGMQVAEVITQRPGT